MDEESRSRRHEHWELVVVLVPEDARDDVLGEVEALMAPYDCDLPVDIYREPCGCVGLEAREEGFVLAAETVLVRDPGRRRRPWTLHSDDEEIWKLGVEYEKAHPLYRRPSPDCEECGGSGVEREELCNRADGQWWEWKAGARRFPGGLVEVPAGDLLTFWRHCRFLESLVTPDGQWHRKPWTAQRGLEPIWRCERREAQLDHWWRRHFVRLLRENGRCTAVAVGAALARWID